VIKRISTELDRILFQEYAFKREFLATYRILYCLAIIGITGLRNTSWIAEIPNFMFLHAYSIAIFFDEVPAAGWLIALDLLTWSALISLLFGYRTKWVSRALTVLLIIQGSFFYAFGKVDHDILYALVPFVMSWSSWGEAYSVDSRRMNSAASYQEVRSWPVAFVAFILSFGIFTSGVQKLLGGWLSLNSNAVRGHLARNFFVKRRTDFLAEVGMHLDSTFLWELTDWMTVVFELLFLVAFCRLKWCRWFVVAAVIFHFMNFFLLNIVYETNFLVYLLFVPPAVLGLQSSGIGRSLNKIFSSAKIFAVTLLLVLLVYYPALYQVGNVEVRALTSLTNLLGFLTGTSGRYLTAFVVITVSTILLLRAGLIFLKQYTSTTAPQKPTFNVAERE
jgi:hypothetical protein